MQKILLFFSCTFLSMAIAVGQDTSITRSNQRLQLEGDTPRVIIAGKTKTVYYDNKTVTVFDKDGKLLKTIMGLKLHSRGHALTTNEDSLKLFSKTIIELVNLEKDTKTILPFSVAGDFNE